MFKTRASGSFLHFILQIFTKWPVSLPIITMITNHDFTYIYMVLVAWNCEVLT